MDHLDHRGLLVLPVLLDHLERMVKMEHLGLPVQQALKGPPVQQALRVILVLLVHLISSYLVRRILSQGAHR